MRSPHPQGSGRDARVALPISTGALHGARWITRSTPEHLIHVAVEFLEKEGFEQRRPGFEDALSESEWTAVALEIGDEERSTRHRFLGLVLDELPVAVPRRFQRVLAPTLVVVAARPVSTRVAELVVFPHTSGRGSASHARAAAPRVRAALEQITAAAGAEGAMLSHESLPAITDDSSPASPVVVRDVLGWR